MKRDLISIEDLNRRQLQEYLDLAARIEAMPVAEQIQLLPGRLLGVLFYEPSTRTRLSFEAAMLKLGGRVIGFSEVLNTSVAKGESLADTIRTVEQYCDAIVIRHPREGAARLAAEVSRLPVINAGDGANQHPTQTLLDLYTIRHLRGGIDGLRIALVGDLKYSRTIHSLVAALARFDNVQFTLVSPPTLALPTYVLDAIDFARATLRVTPSLEEAISGQDILYLTRIQRERFPDALEYEQVRDSYRLDRAMLQTAPPQLKVLHPLPRVNEIAGDVDATPHAAYFPQVRFGMVMRQGLLAHLIGGLK